ncbi:MAG: hypothetical protein ACLR1V_03825 [Coprococcus sp.]
MITNYEYTGSAVIPSVTVKRDSKILKEGTDYTSVLIQKRLKLERR